MSVLHGDGKIVTKIRERSSHGSVISNEKVSETASADFESAPGIDIAAERQLVRKLDLCMIPLFTLIYCTNFIDRTAIGNAKIAGLEKDLHMVGFDYNIALTVFYICFIISEIPSNLALKHFGSMWIAAMVLVFGVVAIATAFVTSFSGLLVTRVFLGLAEGGTLSGLVYVMARYYRRSELVLRVGVFFGLAPSLAGAFGGLLASGLLSVGDFGRIKSWRKIFFIEGIITTAIGLLCFIVIPADPQRSRILTAEQRVLAIARIDADQNARTGGRKERTSLKLIRRSFNVNNILCSLAYLTINVSFQGLSLFMPTVVRNLGNFTTVETQLRTVPPYLVGAVWAVTCTFFSFRTRQRAPPIFASVILQVIGYAIAISTKDTHARYGACFLVVMGGSPSVPLLVAWATDNAAPDTVRAVTTAILPSIGGFGSIIAVWTYLPTDSPDYRKGNSLNLGTSSLACVLVISVALYCRWENAKRRRGERDYRLVGKSEEEIAQLGFLHPNFHFQT